MEDENIKWEEMNFSDRKQLEQKAFLINLKTEIEYLEKEIHKIKMKRCKKRAIRTFKITSKVFQLIYPYALVAGTSLGAFKLSGFLPVNKFYKNYMNVMKEFDNLGNIKYTRSLDDFEDPKNILYIGDCWNFSQEDFYTMNVEGYQLDNDITENDSLSLFQNIDKYLISDEPILSFTEAKNSLTMEEVELDKYLKAVIYYVDFDDFEVQKYGIGQTVSIISIYMCINAFVDLIVYLFRKENFKFDFRSDIQSILQQYSSLDVDIQTMSKKLIIRKVNYERLQGDRDE